MKSFSSRMQWYAKILPFIFEADSAKLLLKDGYDTPICKRCRRRDCSRQVHVTSHLHGSICVQTKVERTFPPLDGRVTCTVRKSKNLTECSDDLLLSWH